jgi:hypothetical protein
MVRVTLPEGAQGVAWEPRGRVTARAGDQVTVSAGHAAAIERFRRTGPASGQRFALGTRRGRRCTPCRRLWNAWSATCPRCGEDTVADTGKA